MPAPQRAYGPPQEAGETPPAPPTPATPQEEAPRKRSRLVLVAVGAVVASLVAIGVNTYDGYVFYNETTTKETREIAVAPGQSGKVYNIEWKAALTPTQAPQGSKHGPEVTWLKVDITQKLLDQANATMIGSPAEVRLEDRTGRSWTVEFQLGDRPTDKLELGKEYRFEGLAIVPTPVANEVELSFRPSGYRSDTPTEDFFKRDKVGKPDVDVLRFRRR